MVESDFQSQVLKVAAGSAVPSPGPPALRGLCRGPPLSPVEGSVWGGAPARGHVSDHHGSRPSRPSQSLDYTLSQTTS